MFWFIGDSALAACDVHTADNVQVIAYCARDGCYQSRLNVRQLILNLSFEVRRDSSSTTADIQHTDRSTMTRSAQQVNAVLSAQLDAINDNVEAAVDEILLDEALHLIEQYLDGELMVANTVQCMSMLQSLVVIGYKRDTLNECTLKAWRLFSRALTVNHVEFHGHDMSEFGSLLRTYCEEGLDALSLNLSAVPSDVEAYFQQELTTIKLLGFFTLRLTEFLQFSGSKQGSDVTEASYRLLLWYTGILGTIGRYSDSAAPLLTKSLQNFEKLRAGVPGDLSGQLSGCISGSERMDNKSDDNGLQVALGAMLTALHFLQRECLDTNCDAICRYLYLYIISVCTISTTYCGMLEDAELLEFMSTAVETISTLISMLESPQSVAAIVEFVTSMSCSAGDTDECVKRRSDSSTVARQILCGLLVSFGTSDQVCLAEIVWQHCKRLLVCNDASCMRVNDVAHTMRAVLQVVDADTCCALLPELLSMADALCGSPTTCEILFSHLPIAHMMSTGTSATVQMLHSFCEQAVITVEKYGGCTGELAGRNSSNNGMHIGTAISLLVATAGYHNSTRGSSEALQHDVWRACVETVKNNVGVGTTLLRWISSLSEHIRTLLTSSAEDAVNMARVQRVAAMASVLTALVRCLWSHSVPRAVQQVLAKAARSCCDAAASLLRAASPGESERTLLTVAALQLMEFASAAMKVAAGPAFSEKSLESIRLVYESWAVACSAAQQSSAPQKWKHCTLFLASLQQFANALPTQIKPRARELVPAHLVPLIQSRALGRTYSLEQQAEIKLTPDDHRHIALHIQSQRLSGVGASDQFERLLNQAAQRITPTDADDLGGEARCSKRPRISETFNRGETSCTEQCAWTASDLCGLLRRTSDPPGGTLPVLHIPSNNGDHETNKRSSMTMAALVLSEQQLCDLGAGSLQVVSGVAARVHANDAARSREQGGDDSFSYTAQSESEGGEIPDPVSFTLSFESTLAPNFTPT